MQRFKRFIRSPEATNILSFSGGKDSTAQYLLALQWGIEFFPVFADTGHEHEKTYEYVNTLHEKTGGPQIRHIRADFSKKFEARRAYIAENWTKERTVKFANGRIQVSPPVPEDRILRAIELMQPSGNPFLDLCMLKGRFPSTKARFCTEELKTYPMMAQIMFPEVKRAGAARRVISWQGVRKQESKYREGLNPFATCDSGAVIWRPILEWKHEDVFALHKKHGVKPNPLYFEGMGRVGCFPCIMCQKSEIAEIAKRYPEHIARVAEWESIVAECSRWGLATFFPDDKAAKPEEYSVEKDGYYNINDVVQWAKTGKGGRQYDLMAFDEPALCESKYGLCE